LRGVATDDRDSRSRGDASLEQKRGNSNDRHGIRQPRLSLLYGSQ
jgi:hypothetical protein